MMKSARESRPKTSTLTKHASQSTSTLPKSLNKQSGTTSRNVSTRKITTSRSPFDVNSRRGGTNINNANGLTSGSRLKTAQKSSAAVSAFGTAKATP